MPMSIKPGTKTFADRATEPGISKDSGAKNLSATEMQNFGGQSTDEILNKIADPNWVDPSKKIRQVGDKNLDKDAFMKLMLTQMKHQDPTNPMQAHEMASQLASFTSLEQLQNLNSTLTEMKKDQAPMANYEMLNFIGKSVSGDSAEIVRSQGDKDHEFKFNLGKESTDVTIKLTNSNGDVVRSFEIKNLKAGENSMKWNGQDDKGVEQTAGVYKFEVEAKDKTGNKVTVDTKFDGTISGVNFSSAGPVLMIGNRGVKLSDVKKIVDPKLEPKEGSMTENQQVLPNDQNYKAKEKTDLKKPAEVAQTVKGNLSEIAMSRKVADQIGKETGKNVVL